MTFAAAVLISTGTALAMICAIAWRAITILGD